MPRNYKSRHLLEIMSLSCCSLLFSFLLISPAGAADKAQPSLMVPESVYDFGEVAQGAVVTHEFELVNLGSGPLKIRKINPSCGCTAALLDDDLIEPGGKVKLRTSFDTTGFQGKKLKTIRIYTNDPRHSSTVFTIKGIVRPDVAFEPEKLDFGVLKVGEMPERTVRLKVDSGSKVRLLELKPRSNELEVERGEQDGDLHSVKVRIAKELPLGIFRGRVLAKTSSAKNPVINLPVTARIVGDLDISPQVASFGLLSGPLAKDNAMRITLTNSGEKPISVLSASSENANVTASFSTIEPGKTFEIVVVLDQKASGIVRAQVVVETDHEHEKTLRIPVYAIVNKSAVD